VYVAEKGGTPAVERGVTATATGAKTRTLSGLGGITGPSTVAITPNGRTAYFTSPAAHSVVPVDVATNTERPAVTRFSSPAAIAITSPPPPNDSAKLLGRLKIHASRVTDRVTCGSPKASCALIETLTTIETTGPTPAVSAGFGGSPSRSGVVIIGSRKVGIGPRRTTKVTIRLNAAGRQLLARFGRVPAVLVLAIRRGGHTDTLTTRKLTI
jgi:hypothetical protein